MIIDLLCIGTLYPSLRDEESEEEPIEILRIEIKDENETLEFDVTAQTGIKLLIFISKENKDFLQGLQRGNVIENIKFHSHFIGIQASAEIIAIRKIEQGLQKGNYNLSLRMKAPFEEFSNN